MSEILTKINKKINFQKILKNEIENIESILTKNIHILNQDEIYELKKEKENLEKNLIKSKLSFEDKFNDFIYTFEDINEAKNIEWLIQNVLPSQSIGVFFGNAGAGKTALILNFCIQMLKNSEDIYIIYIDADMSVSKLKEIGIDELIQEYKNRFFYAGKSVKLVEKTQTFLQEVVELQKNNKTRKYIVIEDSLTLLSPKKNGFIDTNLLYKYEKQIREAGGTVVIIHHLNKSGIFADSQQIENFADYTFLVERNEFNNCILLKPQKASRYDIKEKAYRTEDRKIIDEIDFNMANISYQESSFVKIIIDLLIDGEMNQSEIMKYLKKSLFFTKYSVGEKRIITWLEKWAREGKWSIEQRASDKNAKYYTLSQTEKLVKLPNTENKEI
ncbi:AAA family ATPase [Aliarcobacter butzleri]|uniref:AAA family ATPase n=1 Tax=Aliarcobacter butzleri TaxID=28197 RepID=UPI0021B3AC79|nr:AAA family ATPase [Aliarcobacter butzleri]MCT7611713.1 AAA family ATPase [Aliarcobacter butzleri]MCT7640324.1 AAA family ATPase [Aliarcobacter butzleri]